jgi:hypothetical protein
MSVALLEWVESHPSSETVRRRWTLRISDDNFAVDTEQRSGEGTPALERVLRLILDRAD